MNSEQARTILLRHRPGTPSEADAEVQAALAQASRDPALAAWWADHRQFQEEVSDGLRSIKVPAGLREQILSEKKARLNPWRTPRRWAAGALAALFLGAGLLLWLLPTPDEEAQFATFRSRMVKAALRGYAMDLTSTDLDEIRAYLGTRQVTPDWTEPEGLEAMPLLGCAVLTWRSQPAAMICYGEAAGPDLWLFVMETSAFPDPPVDALTKVKKVNRLNTVSWSVDGRTYLLAGDRTETELLDLVKRQI